MQHEHCFAPLIHGVRNENIPRDLWPIMGRFTRVQGVWMATVDDFRRRYPNIDLYNVRGKTICLFKNEESVPVVKRLEGLWEETPDGRAIFEIGRFRDRANGWLFATGKAHGRKSGKGLAALAKVISANNMSVKEYMERGGAQHHLRYDLGAGNLIRVEMADILWFADPDNLGNQPEPVVEVQPAPEPVCEPEPTPEPQVVENDIVVNGWTLPKEFNTVAKLGEIGQNIMLVGPSGSGKTFLAERLAEHLGRQFAAQSCSAGMSESQLAGWLLPVGDTGKFSYVPSAFVSVYENGGVFLFDEMDAADENTLIFINAALAGKSFHLPQRFEQPRVARHDDFVAVGACNTLGVGSDEVYSGRNQLDGATLDRFRAGVVHVGYSGKVECSLVDEEVLEWGLHIRRVIDQNRLLHIMSTRVMLDFTKQKRELGYGRYEWERSYFADWAEHEIALAVK